MGVWGSIGELGAHYMCEVRFGSVLRFQLGVQKVPLLPEMKILLRVCHSEAPRGFKGVRGGVRWSKCAIFHTILGGSGGDDVLGVWS